MASEDGMTRRAMLAATAAGAGMLLGGGCRSQPGTERGSQVALKNEDFYDGQGAFLADKARRAYYGLMKRFSYPVVDRLKGDEFWAVDFGLKDFVHVGLGGIFWWNSKEHNYFGHEIFLLAGQMIVEHAHVRTPDATPKMEAWHVRHGMVWTFGEGPETQPPPVALPESQAAFITVRHAEPLKPGEVRELNRAEAKHFMVAGPEGAVVTEYATYHDGAALRFTNPGVKF